jgi:hypothetical protein
MAGLPSEFVDVKKSAEEAKTTSLMAIEVGSAFN